MLKKKAAGDVILEFKVVGYLLPQLWLVKRLGADSPALGVRPSGRTQVTRRGATAAA